MRVFLIERVEILMINIWFDWNCIIGLEIERCPVPAILD
jgi:hypothetical protein